ncbi:ATP-binding cassette domain-containing protein [Aureibacillus halotolerans]|uniref:ABC transporter family protein n=1 Tax=Aureibacillus halotolerans TaxID=1508390 RepID=A0A4R6U637_9BACI|nr:ATP-binding cassette domain-containing protein [Aureibacillus halotolerans]TDQ41226.1 ABC transporter family protein [Aureibacillus halotolerans]
MTEQAIITFNKVSKQLGRKMALQDCTFSLPKGGIVGVFVPNGAGKSTLFRLLADFIQPDKGDITLFGDPQVVGHGTTLLICPSNLFGRPIAT